jgi:dephospho-CoA kinase
MNKAFVVGITGGIGSGKSTVCKIFEKFGLPIYYADDRGKYLLNNNLDLKNKITDAFGSESYSVEGVLNNNYLATRVFQNESELAKLNSIVHPAVALDFEDWSSNQLSKIIIKEAALFIENGSYKHLDYLISVIAPEKLRRERVLLRDSFRTKKQVNDILANQVVDSKRIKLSSALINNDGYELLTIQVLDQLNKIHNLALLKDGKPI